MHWLNDLVTWWRDLSDAAAFFYAIPFVVAAAALIADSMRTRGKGRLQSAPPRASPRAIGDQAAAPNIR